MAYAATFVPGAPLAQEPARATVGAPQRAATAALPASRAAAAQAGRGATKTGTHVCAAAAVFSGASVLRAGQRKAARPRCRDVAMAKGSPQQMEVSSHRSASKVTLEGVQAHFVKRLEAVAMDGQSSSGEFVEKTWQRDGGAHGGGKRFGVVQSRVFNRASVNYSAVHYDDVPEKPIISATALSVIIHPNNPFAPSMHCHFSYTEPRKGTPYWRMISDLNPSIHNPHNKNKFEKALKDICPQDLFDDGKLFGDKYFFIPELNMYRGTSHLFLAKLLDTEMDPGDSRELAEKLATATIDTYTDIVQEMLDANPTDTVTERDRELQLAYHTAYFYQVLFLDCGTTAGLLTHAENDVGTLASLPSYISPKLLRRWLNERVRAPHDVLLRRILNVLPNGEGGHDVRSFLLNGSDGSHDQPCHVTDDVRQALATTVREYYLEDTSRTKAQADMDLEWWASRKE